MQSVNHKTDTRRFTTTEHYDVIIIGAGVVGCAVARQFVLSGASVLVVEKQADILEGASKGNSAILHTGFDAPSGSLEHKCIVDGYQQYLSLHKKLGLPILHSGAMVCAWNPVDEAALQTVCSVARDNGVNDIRLLTAQQARQREPGLAASLEAAVSIPGESLVDPWTTPTIYLLQAIENGARIMRHCEVLGGSHDGSWQLETSAGTVRGELVVNCAGLYGDLVEQQLTGACPFQIKPRKGQFVVYDKSAARHLSTIILPVPSATTKGIVVCPTIFGNLLVGPTAEEQDARDDASVEQDILEMLMQRGQQILPALAGEPVNATYAGIRPASQFKDFQLRFESGQGYVSVGGIRSTGLSAALGIASHVFDLVNGSTRYPQSAKEVQWPQLSAIAECAERDWQKPGNEGIVCHCELVTLREVRNALQGPLAAASLGALKRRTRVTMGRCQGFYCSAALARITREYFPAEFSLGITEDG